MSEALEGVKLAEAVAIAQGWERVTPKRALGQSLPNHNTYYVYHSDFLGVDVVRHIGPKHDRNYEPQLNIAQAWELVEALAADGHTVNVEVNVDGTDAAVFKDDDEPLTGWAYCKTTPVAICRAFLKAKEAL